MQVDNIKTDSFEIKQKDKWIIFIEAAFGFCVFLFCDFSSYFDWWGMNEKVFRVVNGKNYYLGQFIFDCDNFILIGFAFLSIHRVTRSIAIAGYFCMLVIDLLISSIFCTITYGPDLNNWNRWLFMHLFFLIFIGKIILHHTYPSFRKLKIFK